MIIEAFTSFEFYFVAYMNPPSQNFLLNKVLDFVVCKILPWREETGFVDVFSVPDLGGLQYQGSHHLPSNCEGDIYNLMKSRPVIKSKPPRGYWKRTNTLHATTLAGAFGKSRGASAPQTSVAPAAAPRACHGLMLLTKRGANLSALKLQRLKGGMHPWCPQGQCEDLSLLWVFYVNYAY